MWLVWIALLAACSKGGGAEGAGGSGASCCTGEGGRAAAGGLATEPATLTMSTFTVETTVPKGWTKAEFGGGFLYSHPGQGISPSTYFITPGCQGDCAKVAENAAGFLDAQRRQHEASGYQAAVVSQAELPGGGREFRLSVTKPGEEMIQVVSVHHRAGWTEVITCSATVLKEDLPHADAFARWCRELKISAKT